MTKYFVLSAFLLAGCGSDEPVTLAETQDSTAVEETATTETSTDETAPSETGSETLDETSGEGGTDAPVADSVSETATDAPADAGGATIKCGAVNCDATTRSCCVETATSAQTCIEKSAACAGGKFACTSPDACGSGQRCCLGAAGAVSGSECKVTCALTETQMCANNADCPSGTACKNLGSGTGYKRCE